MASVARQIMKIPSSKTATHSFIFLHGLGDTPHGWASILHSRLSPSFPSLQLLLPQAPTRAMTMAGGDKMPSWYDMADGNVRDESERQDAKGMEDTRLYVEELIRKEREDGRKVVLGGFSQGGVISILTMLRTQQPLAGVAICSAFVPLRHKITELVSPNFDKDIPIFLAHGKADSTIKIGYGRAAKKLLEWEEIGARNVRFEEYEGMSHSSSEEEMNDLEEWLKGIIDV